MKVTVISGLMAKVLPRSCRLALFVVLACGLSLAVTFPVWGQEDEFQAQSTATYTFGQNMVFSLRAKSADEIVGATLFFNTPEMESTFAANFEVSPATEIVLEHEVALTQVQIAPFTNVRYWWRLMTTHGSIMVDEKAMTYADDRFQWQRLEADGVEVYWTGTDGTLGQVAMDIIEDAQRRLATVLPVELSPLQVYIYPSMADLRSALRLTGRDWLGAEAKPELGVLLVTAVNPRTAAFDLGQSIPHEMSHLLLYRAAGAQYETIPRWLDEGLATSFESTPDVGYRPLLREAVNNQQTMPFAALCASFPASDAEVRLAYAQSAAIVDYIRQEYGTNALRALVQAYVDGAGCDVGVRRALGVSLQELQAMWLAHEAPTSPLVRFFRLNGL